MKGGDILAPGAYTRIATKHGKRIGDPAWIDHPETGRRIVATVEGRRARLLLESGARDAMILCARYGPGDDDVIALVDRRGWVLVQLGRH